LIVRERLGEELPRHALTRVADASAGNVFLALELARSLMRRGALHPGIPLPAAAEPIALLIERLRMLPAATRDALHLLAAMESPSLEVLEAAGGAGVVAALAAASSGLTIHSLRKPSMRIWTP
jgi:hypothetical protein